MSQQSLSQQFSQHNNSHQQIQQGQGKSGSSLDDITQDLDELFESLKIEKQGQQIDQIEKSTLLALLLYLNIDKTETQFFSYVVRTLDQMQSTSLNKDQFKQLFLDPQINTEDLKSEEFAQIFSVFDGQKKGSFSAEDFLRLYKETSEYLNLPEQQKQQVEARIKKDFEIISPEHKEITPIEFFKIINNQG